MDGSTPQHYTIADFVKWHEDGELILNPDFQRGSVWTSYARSYLIDSILRGYPIPKLLLRTKVDRTSRRTIRDVVDGQQRLRTIFDFANSKLSLGPKAGEFEGFTYATLDPEEQDRFLSYKRTCEQLINASDDDVLEVFARINSYAVPVNEPERRNAQYATEFSAYVKDVARNLRDIWGIGVLTERELVRMADQSLAAEIVGFSQRGVTDGSEKDITKLYEDNRSTPLKDLPDPVQIERAVRKASSYVTAFHDEPIVKRPHFLMLIAATMHVEELLPEGKLDLGKYPATPVASTEAVRDALSQLNGALQEPDLAITPRLTAFREARSTTQRMKSRTVRFEMLYRALTSQL